MALLHSRDVIYDINRFIHNFMNAKMFIIVYNDNRENFIQLLLLIKKLLKIKISAVRKAVYYTPTYAYNYNKK